MNPKSGKKIEAIKPQDPEEVFEADEADPGKVATVKATSIKKGSGKYGQSKLPAHKPGSASPSSAASGASSSPVTSASSTSSKAAGTEAVETEAVEEEKSWISIKLTDEKGKAVAGESYEVVLPDGKLAKGTLGTDGTARIEGFDPGKCKVRFPKLAEGSVSKK